MIYPTLKVPFKQTPNTSGKFKAKPKILVLHYTAGNHAYEAMMRSSHKASAHFTLDRNGDIYQIGDTDRTTWHAGVSFWKGLRNLNSYSLGIEIANFGYWRAEKGVPFKSKAEAIQNGWVAAKHKNGGPELAWEPYPADQMDALEELVRWTLDNHPIHEVVGHDDIAPKRKVDPGPIFPMQRFVGLLHSDQSKPASKKLTRYKVNASTLNVRGGPSTSFETLKWGPLQRNAVVEVLREENDWSYIQAGKEEGWVFSQYLTPS